VKQNITKQLCMFLAVYKLLTALLALELALAEYKISKYVHLMQYQFRLFKNIHCFMSFCKHCLDKAMMLLFCNSLIQHQKRKQLLVPNHPH